MHWFRRLKFLPIMILVVMAALFLRVNSFEHNAQRGLIITTVVVQADDSKKDDTKKDTPAYAKPDDKKTDDKKPDDKKSDDKSDTKTDDKNAKPDDGKSKEQKKMDESNHDPLDPVIGHEGRPSSELVVLQDLSERRRQLDKREADIGQREALLQASEKRFEEKLAELTALRDEIKKLMDAANAKTNADTQRLVDVYEKMKPKDAAGIFDTMNMDVLLPIVAAMKETKLSPIMASMSPEKAKVITAALAQKAKVLPNDAPLRAATETAPGNVAAAPPPVAPAGPPAPQ